ncbi:MAG: class I SAM-dependent methyltransferase [Granulosicoccus sp.]
MSNLENQRVRPAVASRYKFQHILGSLIGRRFDHLLDGFSKGQLALTWPDGHTTLHGDFSARGNENAQVVLHNFAPIRQMLLSGENGFAESYLRGDWSTDNLQNLFRLFLNNEHNVDELTGGSWYSRLANSFRHGRNQNSLRGSRRNIEFHYDLGNEFYKLWLDPSMSYSSALFRDGTESLHDAQIRKLDQVVDYLEPRKGSRILEIGCGWGALAQHIAKSSGCRVDGISLSHEQLRYAQHHHTVSGSNNEGVLTRFLHQDYRKINGRFDHIVSIEMFEAVGEQYWRTYFQKLGELLERGGTAVLQVITIAEERFDEYRASPDFIQRYIFPGGMLPSKTRLQELISQSGFDLVQSDWFGQSYAQTLELWRDRFEHAAREVQELGFDDRFQRMWRYYLNYCEAGFRTERTDVGQLLLAKR